MAYSCLIKFNKPNEVYLPNEELSGEIVLTLDKPRKYKGIYIVIIGYSESEWKEKEKQVINGQTKKINEHYKGRRDHFNEIIYLVAQQDGIPVELLSGTHKYPFSYMLPPNLPPSMQGTYGNVTYKVKAVLDRPWRPIDETYKKGFTVITNHVYPGYLLHPKMERQVEQMWCLPFNTMPFTLEVELTKTGFTIGEGIPVVVKIQNESNSTIHEIKFQLRQTVTFYSIEPKRKGKEDIHRILETRCKVMDTRKIGTFQRTLTIPHLPVTFTTVAELISISYHIRIEVKVGGLNKNPSVIVPIEIGSIPHNPLIGSPAIGFIWHNQSMDSSVSETSSLYPTLDRSGQSDLSILNLSDMSGFDSLNIQPCAPPASDFFASGSQPYPGDLAPPSYEDATKVTPSKM